MEALSEKMIELLPSIQEAVQVGMVYGEDLFYRFIQYKIVINVIGLIASIIFFIVGLISIKKSIHSDCEPVVVLGAIFGSLGVILPLAAFFPHIITNIFQLMYIPEIYVLEYFK